VERNLAVGLGGKAMAALFELMADTFVAVELAVDDDVSAAVFAAHGLIAGGEVDDAETRMAQTYAAIMANPLALAVGAAVIETLRGALENCGRDSLATGEEAYDSAHLICPYCREEVVDCGLGRAAGHYSTRAVSCAR
jgi:hypothetical protein